MRQLGQNLATTIREIKDNQENFSNTPIVYQGDWYEFLEPVAYSSANIIAVSNTTVDLTKIFPVGSLIRYKQGGAYQYAYVWRSSTNSITIATGSDYSLTVASITNLAKSLNSTPNGHPVLLKFNPSLTCIGAVYTPGSPSGINYRFSMNGKLVYVSMYDLGGGSVSGACVLQFNLPVPSLQLDSSFVKLNNGTSTVGLAYASNSSVTPTNPELYGVIFKDVTEASLSAGSANHQGNLFYTANN